MVIQTERLQIRPVEESDWQRIGEIWEDFGRSEYAQYDVPNSMEPEEIRLRISKWANANRNGKAHMFFAVCVRDTIIGYSAFHMRDDGYEFGYCFHSDFHGKGYAKECHLALFDYFRDMGATKFSAGTALNNLPSVSLLRSMGFELVGTEKVSFYKDSNGKDIVFDGGIFEKAFC